MLWLPFDTADDIVYDSGIPKEEAMKKCTKCGEVKELGEFNKQKGNPDGLNYKCRECLRADKKKWREANPDKVKQSRRKWKGKNKDKVKTESRRHQRVKTLRKADVSSRHTYLVSDGEFVKIGVFTEGKLRRRLIVLQTGNPRKLKVLATSASNIEKLCHYEFEDLKVLNEWFRLDLRLITFFTENAV